MSRDHLWDETVGKPRPFSCPYCPEAFAARLDRDVHAVTAHDVRGRQPVRVITCRACARDMAPGAPCPSCGWEAR